MKSQSIPFQKIQVQEKNKRNIIDDTNEDIIKHHINSFIENDLDAVLSDYTNGSVLITQDGTYRGREEIKGFFLGLLRHFPVNDSSFVLDKLTVEGDLVFIVWHGKTPTIEVSLGTDTFIVEDKKIKQQTFAGQIKSLS